MSADFFRKKQWWYIALSQLLAGFVGVCMCYAVILNYVAPVWVGKNFYFLVAEDSHIEASTHEARLDGGAGYLLTYDGDSYVAWSVYFEETAAVSVQSGLNSQSKLLHIDVSYLQFKNRKDKKNKKVIEGALGSLYGCIDVLSQGLAKLDQGVTQEACKRILTVLNKEVSYMSEAYRESYPQFSEVCVTIKATLSDILTKTIYGKDLRYILCWACDAYIRLASVFSL